MRETEFTRELNDYFESIHAPIHIEQCASMLFLKFLEEYEFSTCSSLYLRSKGVHILEGGSFFLTTAHTDKDLAFVTRRSRKPWFRCSWLPAKSAV